MTHSGRFLVAIVVAVSFGGPLRAAEPEFLQKTSPQRASQLKTDRWIDVIEREIPKLTNDPSGHMPMIMWHGVGFASLSERDIEVLRERGLCQHLQLSASMIPAAKVLQQAGMPVILMEGRTDSWPYSLGKDWAHQFDASYTQPWFGKDDSSQWHGACPHRTEGWNVLANETTQLLQEFRKAGVRVDAVLVDYEGDPYPWSQLFDQLRHCKRCRRELPSEIVHQKAAWRDHAWKQYVSLYDEHFAKPIREVFPDCLVTNWHVVFSTPGDPIRYFVRNVDLPNLAPQHFSATNPIAYASDAAWHALWDPSQSATRMSIDTFYRTQVVQQVAADKRNRELAGAGHVRSIPWVARVCKIAGGDQSSVPIMTRAGYRDALGELWELGVHSMQVFNPMHEGYEELALTELQDAVAAYDKMLELTR